MNASPLPSSALQTLEQETYRSWLDDGLIDLALGLATVVFGLTYLTDVNVPGTQFDVFLLVIPFLPALLWQAKRTIVEPRAGYVRLRAPLRQALKRRWVGLVWLHLLLTLTLVLGIHLFGLDSAASQEVKKLAVALTFAVPVACTGPLLRAPRWGFYGSAIAVAGGLEYFLSLPFGCGWLATGILILAIGSARLLRFIDRHPLPSDTYADD